MRALGVKAVVVAGLLCTHGASAADLQAAAEGALGPRPGGVVALEVRGERLLAIVNPRVAVGQAFPVGSLFKLAVARAALEQGIADPGEKIDCRNVFTSDGKRLRCSVPSGHGRLDIIGALAQSCNVHFYHLARRLGAEAMLRQARALGLGRATGLYSGEAAGSVPEHVAHESVLLLGIGDVPGLTATVLQVARLAARLARERETEAGRVLHQAMVLAVTEGTAQAASVSGLSVAGKTGSPSRPSGRGTYAWFAGFAPAEEPEIAVAVLVLEGHGRDTAAPIAGKIFAAWQSSRNQPVGSKGVQR